MNDATPDGQPLVVASGLKKAYQIGDRRLEVLRGVRPADPAKPVLIPGDPEEESRAGRLVAGIPIPASLEQHVREIAARAGVEFLLKAV